MGFFNDGSPARFASAGLASLAWVLAGCGGGSAPDKPDGGGGAPPGSAAHSSTLALDGAEERLFVVQPDGDAVSVVDVRRRVLVREIALGPAPVPDAAGRYTPAVAPRSLSVMDGRVYVACERSGEVVAIDAARLSIATRRRVCARPIGIAAAGGRLFVSCAADAEAHLLDPVSLRSRVRVTLPDLPWAVALEPHKDRAHVAHLHGPVTTLGLSPLEVVDRIELGLGPRGDRLLAHGAARALFDLAPRPGGGELWIAHELHAGDTPQPALDFESTVFPGLAVHDGETARTLTADSRRAGRDGDIGDVVSGPRAIAFTPDGRFALVVAQASEDVLVVDAVERVQVGLVRPLPGHWPQGIVITADGTRAFVDERNSGDVAVLTIERDGEGIDVRVDGDVIPVRPRDPMPPELRLGQRVFHTANSAEIPITTNHWVSCASCHTEGTTDRMTWLFLQGPRDTPSNAGGPHGFQFRTADRNAVTDYWKTIRVEQGGQFLPDDEVLRPFLDAVAAFTERAIPLPPPPTTDRAQVARGRAVFERDDVGCATCHHGPALSDSGAGNASLDLRGELRLHDVGSCVSGGPHPDAVHAAIDGSPREPCRFDTPALRGLAESAPYLHAGQAATLRDVVTTANREDRHGRTSHLGPAEIDDLVEYLRSL
jgi:DNA-binding beta-propeller fold protein YncE/mono/diheme cytochrome c family protein